MSFLGISLVAFGAALVLGAVEKALSLTAGSFESFPAEPVYAANGSLGFAIAGVAGLDAGLDAGFGVEVGVAMAGVAGLGVEVGVAGLGVEVGDAMAGVAGLGVVSDEEFGVGLGAAALDPELLGAAEDALTREELVLEDGAIVGLVEPELGAITGVVGATEEGVIALETASFASLGTLNFA